MEPNEAVIEVFKDLEMYWYVNLALVLSAMGVSFHLDNLAMVALIVVTWVIHVTMYVHARFQLGNALYHSIRFNTVFFLCVLNIRDVLLAFSQENHLIVNIAFVVSVCVHLILTGSSR